MNYPALIHDRLELMVEVEKIKAWHLKMMEDSRTGTGLVDFHDRERNAHVYIATLLAAIDNLRVRY